MRLLVVLPALLLLAALPASSAQSTLTLSDAYPEIDRWVEATMEVEQTSYTAMEVTGILTIRKFEVKGTEYDSADDLSSAYFQLQDADRTAEGFGQAGGRADAFVKDMEANTTAALREMLENAFPGAEISVGDAALDRATFQASDARPFEPGVRIAVTAVIERSAEAVGLGTVTDDDVDALFDAGATVTSEMRFQSRPGYDVTYAIAPPAGTYFASVDGAERNDDGTQMLVDVHGNNGDVPVTLALRGAGAPTYTAPDAAIDITVDLKDLDVSIGQAIGGDFGNLLMDLSVDANLGVIEVPESLAAGLPERVSFDYLSSDAIRLLVQRGKISDAELVKLEESLLKKVGDQLGAALGGTVTVAGGFDDASFAASHIATPLSGDKPLVFHASASLVKPLSGGEVQPAAAMALYSTSLPLSLPKVQGLDTTYTVILPRGLAVTDLTATGGAYETGKAADGRDQFVVTPTEERAEVAATMAVTPTFVMAKFWPVVLLAVILLVLIVGTPIALIMRRRKSA